MNYDLIISNYVHTISDEEFEQRVPDNLKPEIIELEKLFNLKRDNNKPDARDYNKRFTQDVELWLEMIGRIKFSLEVAKNPIFIFISNGSSFDKFGNILDISDYQELNIPRFGIKAISFSDVDRYDLHPEIQKYFNRDFIHCSGDNIKKTLAEFGKNRQKVVIKVVYRPESGFLIINPDEELPTVFVDNLFFLEGDKDILIQEYAKIEYQMRCFCVDGEVITSAGNVSRNTWIDNIERFDPQLQKNASKESEVKICREIRDELLEFARKVATEIAPIFQNKEFVIDVAMINGRPGIVELNSLSNAGLFACDAKALIKRICERKSP